ADDLLHEADVDAVLLSGEEERGQVLGGLDGLALLAHRAEERDVVGGRRGGLALGRPPFDGGRRGGRGGLQGPARRQRQDVGGEPRGGQRDAGGVGPRAFSVLLPRRLLPGRGAAGHREG